MNPFEKWLVANGFTPADISDEQRTTLQAAFDLAEGKAPQVPAADDENTKTEEEVAAAATEVERERIVAIEAACKGFDDEKIVALRAKAIAGEIDAAELQAGILDVVREQRPKPPAAGSEAQAADRQIILAAAYQDVGMPDADALALVGQPAMDRAVTLRGMGLQELCARVCASEGVELPRFQSSPREWLTAAFSTISLAGILGNVANKALLTGFDAVENVWQAIAATRNVTDFKETTSYRMTGAFEFEEIGPTGELHHGDVDELEYVNRARTYGRMFSITRADLINDDLGALTQVPGKIGRGAALKLNLVAWTTFLANTDFFKTANKNYKSGTATALAINAITTAVQMFRDQTDPDGKPLAIQPRILLVPNNLEAVAKQIYKATELRDTTASTKYPTANPHTGSYEPKVSAYLNNTGITGYSITAWYLLADPRDEATIEVVFLNGVRSPTVERADADFHILGIEMRGFFDFGAALREPRGGVKMKGTT